VSPESGDDDEKFLKEKSEIFPLVLCIMLQNKLMFKYLLQRCSFIWNEVHLVLLTTYVLEAKWVPGIIVLFSSSTTHALFTCMNLPQKLKYLEFCERSINMARG
jgi:hypothetical protein